MLIDRGERREVTDDEEQQIREEISHAIRSPAQTSLLLHIPDEDDTPLCLKTKPERWHVDPIETWPPGHREFCCTCTDRFLHDDDSFRGRTPEK